MKIGPDMVIFDIETSHDILASYGLREQRHSPDNILQDWYIICAKWRRHGAKRTYGTCVLDDMERFKADCSDDYVVVKALHEMLGNVDVVIGHNVKSFDWRTFYTRVIYHRLPPLPTPQFIDTLKEYKKICRNSSNSLKHLARYHKLEHQKIEHSRHMGMKILRGDVAATKECYDYCGGDIDTTEEFFDLIGPHMVQTGVNQNAWHRDGDEHCPFCASTNLISNGWRYTMAGKHRRCQCNDCGKWSKHSKLVRGAGIR